MRRVKLDDDGCSVNFDHIVMVEKIDNYAVARLVSGSTVTLKNVYSVAYDLIEVSIDPWVWVNPVHVSTVGVGYNSAASIRDVMDNKELGDTDHYTQVQIETVLGKNHYVWSDIYGVDEIDYLAGLLLDGGE